jgi:hypothetical protein
MQTWILFFIGAVVVTMLADVPRATGGSNFLSQVLWGASLYLLWKAWDGAPWRESHPVISGIAFFAAYMIVIFLWTGVLYSRLQKRR